MLMAKARKLLKDCENSNSHKPKQDSLLWTLYTVYPGSGYGKKVLTQKALLQIWDNQQWWETIRMMNATFF